MCPHQLLPVPYFYCLLLIFVPPINVHPSFPNLLPSPWLQVLEIKLPAVLEGFGITMEQVLLSLCPLSLFRLQPLFTSVHRLALLDPPHPLTNHSPDMPSAPQISSFALAAKALDKRYHIHTFISSSAYWDPPSYSHTHTHSRTHARTHVTLTDHTHTRARTHITLTDHSVNPATFAVRGRVHVVRLRLPYAHQRCHLPVLLSCGLFLRRCCLMQLSPVACLRLVDRHRP